MRRAEAGPGPLASPVQAEAPASAVLPTAPDAAVHRCRLIQKRLKTNAPRTRKRVAPNSSPQQGGRIRVHPVDLSSPRPEHTDKLLLTLVVRETQIPIWPSASMVRLMIPNSVG